MLPYDILTKTKRKAPLTAEEIQFLVRGTTDGGFTDAQLAAWTMAVCLNGLTDAETAALTLAMRDSGDVLDLSGVEGVTADKHSTGGVGDKTSLILAPIVAACGVKMPKMSGRGLGHTGGTIDKLESIPGFSVNLSFDRFLETVNTAGFAIVAQSGHLVPADKKLYALRDHTATVDSIPLICASIMSKKLAMGADVIVLDVKLGSGAFMKTEADAKALAQAMVAVGRHAGKRCRALVTDMDAPLGFCVGNAIEVAEAIDVLRGADAGVLRPLCLELAAQAVSLAENVPVADCQARVRKALDSGAALERLAQMIALQGGDPSVTEDTARLPQPKNSHTVKATQNGFLAGLDSEQVGLAAMSLGAGRVRKDADLDLSAGIRLHCAVGDEIRAGEPIATLYSSAVSDFSEAEARLRAAVKSADCKPVPAAVVRCVVQ